MKCVLTILFCFLCGMSTEGQSAEDVKALLAGTNNSENIQLQDYIRYNPAPMFSGKSTLFIRILMILKTSRMPVFSISSFITQDNNIKSYRVGARGLGWGQVDEVYSEFTNMEELLGSIEGKRVKVLMIDEGQFMSLDQVRQMEQYFINHPNSQLKVLAFGLGRDCFNADFSAYAEFQKIGVCKDFPSSAVCPCCEKQAEINIRIHPKVVKDKSVWGRVTDGDQVGTTAAGVQYISVCSNCMSIDLSQFKKQIDQILNMQVPDIEITDVAQLGTLTKASQQLIDEIDSWLKEPEITVPR